MKLSKFKIIYIIIFILLNILSIVGLTIFRNPLWLIPVFIAYGITALAVIIIVIIAKIKSKN